ncbi:MAG: GNAT family protein [Armatimonadetes bacterium]|nr:GNAT family protein [Armatimonadota bacterium]
MMRQIDGFVLRPPEISDLEALHRQKNDQAVVSSLGGFSTGYSRDDVLEWINRHRKCADEALWIIADAEQNKCLGHVGLYKVNHRIRSAEFAIMIGEKSAWGKGLGRNCSNAIIEFGFREMNLNRLSLTVMTSNEKAIHLYRSIGFKEEGIHRQAQYKNGQYQDLMSMSMLHSEYLQNPIFNPERTSESITE